MTNWLIALSSLTVPVTAGLEVIESLLESPISLQNARLYQDLENANQQLESYNQTLEQKVAARTIELNDKNQHLQAAFKEAQRNPSATN